MRGVKEEYAKWLLQHDLWEEIMHPKKKAKEIAMKVCSSSLAVTVADVVNP